MAVFGIVSNPNSTPIEWLFSKAECIPNCSVISHAILNRAGSRTQAIHEPALDRIKFCIGAVRRTRKEKSKSEEKSEPPGTSQLPGYQQQSAGINQSFSP
jgi:hypothetical protein